MYTSVAYCNSVRNILDSTICRCYLERGGSKELNVIFLEYNAATTAAKTKIKTDKTIIAFSSEDMSRNNYICSLCKYEVVLEKKYFVRIFTHQILLVPTLQRAWLLCALSWQLYEQRVHRLLFVFS